MIPVDRGLFHVLGPDARKFLQDLISNDINLLNADSAIYACLLTPQGKFLHDFFVTPHGDGFLIDSEGGARRDDLIARLSAYKLRRKVDIAPVDDHAVLVGLTETPSPLRGEGRDGGEVTNTAVFITPTLTLPPPAREGALSIEKPPMAAGGAGIKAYKDPRHPDMGWRAIVPLTSPVTPVKTGVQSNNEAQHGCAHVLLGPGSCSPSAHVRDDELSFEDWDYRRISLTIPDGSRDAEVGVSTLEELNIPRLNGVSFTKGCYVGQELTARMQNRNLGKRHLKTVKLDALPEGAEPRSSCRDIGLALVRD